MPGVIETRHHEVYTTPERMAEYRKETPLGRWTVETGARLPNACRRFGPDRQMPKEVRMPLPGFCRYRNSDWL